MFPRLSLILLYTPTRSFQHFYLPLHHFVTSPSYPILAFLDLPSLFFAFPPPSLPLPFFPFRPKPTSHNSSPDPVCSFSATLCKNRVTRDTQLVRFLSSPNRIRSAANVGPTARSKRAGHSDTHVPFRMSQNTFMRELVKEIFSSK